MKIKALSNIDSIVLRLGNNQKQLAFATAVALTKTAQQVKVEEIKEMRRAFDRPTEYTLNSLFVKPATKNKLESMVYLKDDVFKGTPAAKYILPNIAGGERKTKRWERALINSGVMPSGYFAVPGEGVELDAYGNIPNKFIVQLLSYLRAFGEQGYKANATDKGRSRFNKQQSKKVGGAGVSYFVINKPSHLLMGIYMRVTLSFGTTVKPIVIFVRDTKYKTPFKFNEVAQKTIKQVFPLYLKESVDLAISTQR